ncbi:hypothetical protein HK104_000746, partial [Borealophlyctis nickersoniae]
MQRPLTREEEWGRFVSIWEPDEDANKISLSLDYAERYRKNLAEFYYDVVQTGSDNKSLYEHSARDVIHSAMEGLNGTVFAYGQTASGKTYSMMGIEEQPGIIPQAVDDVFNYIREQNEDREYLLRVSYMEIYNESIRDLLAPDQMDLRIHEDRKRGVFVSPLKEEIVTSPKQVMKIIKRGEENRHVGTTDFNLHSSRSHAIFQMIIESRDRSAATPTARRGMAKPRGSVTISHLNLIDLAGSEKATSDAERRKEGAYINKSLLTLGTVISRLTDEKSWGTHVPYRDSKLTRILQSSLSGNARICVICTISPAASNHEETLNTLKFAARVKKVVIRATANKVMDDKAMIQKYKQEIEELRQKLIETNSLLEKERQYQATVRMEGERAKYEEQLHESQLVGIIGSSLARTAMKERIDHLTKLILTSNSVTPKGILDWNAALDSGNNRGSVMMSDGLLPASPNNSGDASSSPEPRTPNRRPPLNRQMTDQTFIRKHIQEIEVRDSRIKQLELVLMVLKSSSDSFVQSTLSQFEKTIGASVQSVDVMMGELEELRRQKENLEMTVAQRDGAIETLEGRTRELTEELDKVSAAPAAPPSDPKSTPEYKQVQKDLNKAQSALRDAELREKQYKKDAEQVSDLVNQQREQIKTATDESRQLKSTLAELRERVQRLEDEKASLSNRLSNRDQEADLTLVRPSRGGGSVGSTLSGDSYPTAARMRDVELALERERRIRLEEQKVSNERIAELEAEVAVLK